MPTEREIIKRIRERARANPRVLVGIGDDAAVLTASSGNLIACCDLMVEGVHFRTEWASPKLLGHKALAVTLSDVAAMGATARFAMVSVALPPATSSEFVDELFAGIFDLADRREVSIVGGDTSSSPGPLFIDTSVIGECAKDRAITRAGANPGDIIYVTGDLGASAVGLSLLEHGYTYKDRGPDEKDEAQRSAIFKHLAPEPRLEIGKAIGEAGLASAMIDISDGLSTDLWRILDESGCGALIHAGSIPIADCVGPAAAGVLRIDPLSTALHSGEEYELLFTSRKEHSDRLFEMSKSFGVTISAVGEILPDSGLYLERDNQTESILPSGYEHRI